MGVLFFGNKTDSASVASFSAKSHIFFRIGLRILPWQPIEIEPGRCDFAPASSAMGCSWRVDYRRMLRMFQGETQSLPLLVERSR